MSDIRSPIELLSKAEGSDQLFESLLDSAPDAIVIVDKDGRISIVNAEAEKMFGYSRKQMWNKKIELLISERYRSVHVVKRQEFSTEPRSRSMGVGLELFGRRSDGTDFPVEISLSPLKTSGGLFISSAIRDVTERKKLERETIAAKQAAERANKANSAFLAAASHDLRQPVQALSLINGALRRTVTDPKALEMIDSQGQSLTAMTNLLNSLLDISRLDAGAISPEIEDFPINRLIERLSSEFSRQATQKDLSFNAAPCDAIVRSDPNLVSEIIQNLVSNGIRYTDSGSVTLACHLSDTECRIEICDTGIGISADQIDRIFEEFHQCRTRGSSKEGFGLGLAIVRRLADLLEHEISVDSTPGQGSCFSVSVPIVGAIGDHRDSKDSGFNAIDPREGSGFVLLVEDDAGVANALQLLFESCGYQVACAASKIEAVAILRGSTTDLSLIVSDYHLIGNATGVEAIAVLRKQVGKNVPAIIITGDTSETTKETGAVQNCVVINKPVDPDRLLAVAYDAIETGVVPV